MSRDVVVLLVALIAALGLFLFPRAAFADPHAVFYTDNGFKQVFYAVLAALNQADYVEPPRQPAIQTIQRLGDEIARTTNEPERVQLPRIRVRQVTSDDGDVFFREELWRRAEEKRAKVNVSITTCKILRIILGTEETNSVCQNT